MASLHPPRGLAALLLALFCMIPVALHASADMPANEIQIKAERLCTFPHFVQWPAKKFLQASSPFVIGIFGEDERLAQAIRETIQTRRIKSREVIVRVITRMEEVPACHMLFISRREAGRTEKILRETRHESVLTVGDGDAFLTQGGMICLIESAGRLAFQLNLKAALKEGLRMDPQLIQNAAPLTSLPKNPKRLVATTWALFR